MWCIYGGEPEHPGVMFHYSQSRSADTAEAVIGEYTGLFQAVGYTLEQWPALVRYLESPYLTPDTNRVENAIRPFVVGRRNWLFAGSPRGAHASARLYSLIQTCRVNNIEPYRYLRTLFHQLSHADEDIDHSALLPQFIEIDD